jgi:pimeloyl-ACP methyl ester carboxylesterase
LVTDGRVPTHRVVEMRRPSRLVVVPLLLGALLATACAEISDEELDAIAGAAGDSANTSTASTPFGARSVATPAGREGAPPEIEGIACPFDGDGLADVDCGTIELPGRGVDDDYRVEIAFARFFATGDAGDVQPDPVVYLHGGPGGAILDEIEFWYDSIVAPHIDHRDVILYDQRGGGQSTTLPLCHETIEISDRFYEEASSHESLAGDFVAALDECALKFRDRTSVDVTAFNSAANAQDLVDLLWALGVDEYNLHGSSYGTRLAQTVMRDAPQGVRSLVLSGTYPIEANLMGSVGLSMESSLNAVFDGCAASELCNEALPDPWATLEALVEDLDANPLRISVATSYDESYPIVFDGTDLINGLHSLLYVGYDAASIPDMLIDHLDGDDRRIRRLGRTSVFDHTDTATFLLVQCADEASFTNEADLSPPLDHEFLRAVDLAPSINGLDSLSICDTWDTGEVDPIENEAVSWAAPTLLLAGAVDPITPPNWAADLAAKLPRSRLVVQAGASHDSDEGWCALGLIGEFVARPDALLDTSCAASDDELLVDSQANRFRADMEFLDSSLDLDGDGVHTDLRLPDWITDWRDDVHLRWRALDPIDPTALIVLDGGADYDLVDHLTFVGDIPDWLEIPRPIVPSGWTRWEMATTGGTLVSYVRDSDALEIALVIEPGEQEDLEKTVLVPTAESVGNGS